MREQAKTMQFSADALKHTLDKVARYKEDLTKAQSVGEVTELELSECRKKITEYEHDVIMKKSELEATELGLYDINQILDSVIPGLATEQLKSGKVNEKCIIVLQKVTEAINILEVKNVIDRIVDVIELSERDLTSVTRIASLERSCEQFRKLAMNSEWKVEEITGDNIPLEIKLQERESDLITIKEDYENEKKINNLEKERIREREKVLSEDFSKFKIAMEESLSSLKSRLVEKDGDIKILTERNLRLSEDRERLENIFKTQKSKSLMCDDGEISSDQSNRDPSVEALPESPEVLRSNSHSEQEIFHLKLMNSELRQLLETKKETNLSQGIDRMTASYRELNWTCHQQQVTIQNLRAENRHLRKNVTDLHKLLSEQDNAMVEGYSTDTEIKRIVENYSEQVLANSGTSEDEKLTMIEENSDELSSNSVETASFALPDFTSFNTAVVRPFNMQTRSDVMLDKEKKHDVPTAVSRKKSGSDKELNNDSSTDNENDIVERKPHRRRSRMRQNSSKLQHCRNQSLPIWRQENPGNIFHASTSGKFSAFPVHRNEELDDVFTTSPDIEKFLPLKVVERCHNSPLLDDEQVSQPPEGGSHGTENKEYRPMLGIPMSQDKFDKLTTHDVRTLASTSDGPLVNTASYKNDYSSSKDDGYCSSVFSSSDVYHRFPANSKTRSLRKNKDQLRHCYVTYKEITFDAVSFNLTQMRNVAWAAGISESSEEMDNFFEFLSKKSFELTEDPEWRGRHSLGKPFEWMNMRGQY